MTQLSSRCFLGFQVLEILDTFIFLVLFPLLPLLHQEHRSYHICQRAAWGPRKAAATGPEQPTPGASSCLLRAQEITGFVLLSVLKSVRTHTHTHPGTEKFISASRNGSIGRCSFLHIYISIGRYRCSFLHIYICTHMYFLMKGEGGMSLSELPS